MKLTDNLYFYPERGMLDCNTYLIKGDTNILIDPGSTQFLSELLSELRKDGIDPKDINLITNTHLHIDHCWSNDALKKLSGARILIHATQKEFYHQNVVNTASLFGLPAIEFKEDGCFESNILSVNGLELMFFPSPGHSPDSICFYSPEDKFLICGDVVFQQNTGRVDLPGGSAAELKKSIRELAKLEIDYLLPGHMEPVEGREQVQKNFEFVIEHIFDWL